MNYLKIVAAVVICLPALNAHAQKAFYGNKNANATVTITSCYADETLGLNVQEGASATQTDLQTQSFYENLSWNFDTVWKLKAGEFPMFQWQEYENTGMDRVNADVTWNIIGENNRIEVTVSKPLFLSVYTIAGINLFANQVDNAVSIPAKRGIYILKLKSAEKETVQKIIVK